MATDQALLAQYAEARDADAFAELVRRYAGMVYGTGLRITRSHADAEDVAQQCFLHLARHAGDVRASLGGWLHHAARTRSINALRDAATRRRHEEQAMAERSEDGDATWDDIAPHVDAALDDLPDDLRAPLLLHYLQGRPQAEVAEALGVSQSTVSRRLEKGVDGLRERLRKAGVVASVGALAALLGNNAATAAPPALTAALGKMAVAGIGTPTAVTVAAAGSGAAAAKVAAGVLIAAVALTVGGLIVSERRDSRPAASPAPSAARVPAPAGAAEREGQPVGGQEMSAETPPAREPQAGSQRPIEAEAQATQIANDQEQRLMQWQNLFGPLERCIEAAERDPVFYELLRVQLALEPVSDKARQVRNAMSSLEPAELTYPARIDALFGGLAPCDARGGLARDWPQMWRPHRARIAERAASLRVWLDRGTGELAPILGEPDEAKRSLVALTLFKMERNAIDAGRMAELSQDDRLAPFVHRIDHLDWELWSHARNFDLLVRGIGGLQPVGEWHTRSGPLGWADGEPVAKPKAEAMLARLDAWLAGGDDADLGARDAYPEKVWLARCLATYLRYHLRGYWNWMTKGANMKREGDRVWIEGVKGFSPAEYADSVHGSQARILQAVGEEMGYDDLVCYGGFAFRIGWHVQGCPSAGHPCCGYMCLKNAYRALPWRTKIYELFPGNKKSEDEVTRFKAEVCAAIKDSIDRGVPVHYGSEEDGLIIGYADEGRRWWCTHPYHKWGAEPFWYDEAKGFAGGKDWPWGIVVFLKPKPAEKRADERELLVAALEQAVTMWKTEKVGDYFCGDEAYEHWLAWLRDVDAGTVEKPKDGMQGNGWCFDVLTGSRDIAGRWLKAKAEGLDGAAREQLLIAADHYARIGPICMEGLECSWELAPEPKKFEQWTSAMRQEQIKRLEAARDHDRAAVAAIGEALKTFR